MEDNKPPNEVDKPWHSSDLKLKKGSETDKMRVAVNFRAEWSNILIIRYQVDMPIWSE